MEERWFVYFRKIFPSLFSIFPVERIIEDISFLEKKNHIIPGKLTVREIILLENRVLNDCLLFLIIEIISIYFLLVRRDLSTVIRNHTGFTSEGFFIVISVVILILLTFAISKVGIMTERIEYLRIITRTIRIDEQKALMERTKKAIKEGKILF